MRANDGDHGDPCGPIPTPGGQINGTKVIDKGNLYSVSTELKGTLTLDAGSDVQPSGSGSFTLSVTVANDQRTGKWSAP